MTTWLNRYKREIAPLAALVGLLIIVAIAAPSFYGVGNLSDLAINNAPALLVAVGMTLIILVKEIDISVASQFAVCSVLIGLLAKAGLPIVLLVPVAMLIGATLGALNGVLVAVIGLPSIIVTLATYVTLRDMLRWATEGAWVQNLPNNFQWFGLAPDLARFILVATSLVILAAFAWALRWLPAGRSVYAVGSNADAARIAGIDPSRVRLSVFIIAGALVGIAATLNAVRFTEVPSNPGVGLEMKAIAAVVVGGTAISGGRGRLVGTLIGVVLLGTIGTALTFVGINPFWEKAIQGAIILAALASDAVLGRIHSHVRSFRSVRTVG